MMRSGSPSLHRSSLSKRGKHRARAAFPEKARCGGNIVSGLLQGVSQHCGEGDRQPRHPIHSCDVAAGEEGKRQLPRRSSERQARLSAQRGRVQLPGWTLGGNVASRTASSPGDGEPLGGVPGENERKMVPQKPGGKTLQIVVCIILCN